MGHCIATETQPARRCGYEGGMMDDLVQRLRACGDDPMWADHCEMSKKTALRAADEIERLRAELDLRRKSAVDRLHNICEGIAADADGSEWSREEWERIDAENASLRAQLAEATRYAETLAVSIHSKHYAEVTQWKPLPDVLGILTQIDNMTAGLGAQLAERDRDAEKLREAAIYAAHTLEKARIWNGMEWHYNPLHPIIYRSALKRLRTAIDDAMGLPNKINPVV